jgi:hypothetical protein
MSAHASGVFGVGVDPPPDSTDPSLQVATSVGSPLTAPRSAWVICPTFSSSVIAASSSSARSRAFSEASIHGRPPPPAVPATEGAATIPTSSSRQVPRTPSRMGRSTRRINGSSRSRPRSRRGETAQYG